MALLPIRARLSSLDDDDDDGGDGDVFDDATDYGDDDEEGEVVEEVSNGFFRVARVPPPPPPGKDSSPASGASPSESEYFGAAEGSLDGSFQSSRSLVGVFDDAASADFVAVSDFDKQGDREFGAEAVHNVAPEPLIGDDLGIDESGMHVVDEFDATVAQSEDEIAQSPPAQNAPEKGQDGTGMHIVDELEAMAARSQQEVTESPAVVGPQEKRDAGVEPLNDDSDAKYSKSIFEDATDVEGSSTEYSSMRDGTSELLEVPVNVDDPLLVADGDQNEVDGETDGDYEASDQPASMPTSGANNAAEILGRELEDNVPTSNGGRFGFDGTDDEVDYDDDDDDEGEEVNGKGLELFDYAALAELLMAANRSPVQGKAKVFPVESSVPQQPPPAVVSIPTPNVASTPDPDSEMTDEERKLYRKVDMARLKYLRLIHRLGYDTENQVSIQVLYRLTLVEGFRRIRVANHPSELGSAWKRALQLEAEGMEDLEFSCTVLVLGKTGVGKSATINSIFGEDKSKTNAFLPATSSVKEIAGVVGGVKLRVIDTPGLGSTLRDEKSNRKVLNSVKKYIKRCPPDIVLYVDRFDTQRQDASTLSLLRCITSVLGVPIWSKTIITLTHSAAAPPEGPSGSPMNYEIASTHRTHALQQSIRQATNDPRIENPVALVENHPLCRRNTEGEKVLPNGIIWRRLLLLLCYSLKMVGEIDSIPIRRVAPANFFNRLQMIPLPYFLSSLLQSREHPRCATEQNVQGVDLGFDPDELMEDEEDEYDQLPPFKPLSKSQVAELSKEQQKMYFDEYDYRTKLLQKKQLKEQLRSLKEMKREEGNNHNVVENNDHPDDEYDTDRSPMPDYALPSSFDSDDPVYRYRCLEPSPNLLVRAVTNSEGWDHDCGYDGVSLQHTLDVANTFPSSLYVRVNKDKTEFTIHLESSISAKHGEHASTLAGFDVQTMMDQLVYTLRGETKLRNFKKNTTTGGLSMTILGDTMVTGVKFEDKLSVGERLTLVANTGAVSMRGDTAYGVNIETTLREKDYPMGQGLATLGASLVRWHKEWTMAANMDTQFHVGRTSNMAVHVDLNNKLAGRVSIKANTSEQLKIALLGACSAAMYLWNKMHPFTDDNH